LKTLLIAIGKTDEEYLKFGIDKFVDRVKRYMPFEFQVLPDIKQSKNLSEIQQKEKEGELLLKNFQAGDFIVLLDENGKQMSSVRFSQWLNNQMVNSPKRLVFVIGGPYGFSKQIYNMSNYKLSLSEMTFSHQMIRLFFVEQLYRANAILKGEPYHHQ